MSYRLNIRYRIFLTYPLLGCLISLIIILFFVVSFDMLERQFMKDFLLDELEHFIESNRRNPMLTEQFARHWSIYKADTDHPVKFLDFLSAYPPGTYDVVMNDRMHDVGIAEVDGARFYILYNDESLEELEINLIVYLTVGAALIVWAAIAYGLWFSKRVLKPIMSLADEVKSLDLDNADTIAVKNYAQDEVGFLASALDGYVNRIKKLIDREREFTANASHELRTPLAIIKTATESTLLRKNLPEDLKPKLLRIDRAANEMNECLQALLILSREPETSAQVEDGIGLVKVLEQLLEDYEPLRPPDVAVVKQFVAHPVIRVPAAMLSIVLGNLIKNAFSNTFAGTVRFEVMERQISISDTGQGISSTSLEHIFKRGYKGNNSRGQGLGLSLIQRICAYYRWQLSIESVSGKGTVVTLVFVT